VVGLNKESAVPESKGRRFAKKSSTGSALTGATTPVKAGPNPVWYAPVMVGLMVLGLIWIVTFYLTATQYPVPSLGNWNLAIGFGLIIVGFLMTTNWR
jgi:cell division protein CrgA